MARQETLVRRETPVGRDALLWAGRLVVLALACAALPRMLGEGTATAAPAVPLVVAAALAAAALVRPTGARVLDATARGLAAAAGSSAVAVALRLATAASAAEVTPGLAGLPVQAALLLLLTPLVLAAGPSPRSGRQRGGRPAAADPAGTPLAGPRRRAARRAVAVTAAVVAASGLLVAPAWSAARTAPDVATCGPGEQQRTYEVAAATVDIPFNRWGTTLRSGRVFVLEQDRAAVENWWRPLADDPADDPAANRRLRPRPLVLRANEGECVEVVLTNRMQREASHGLPADPRVGISATGVVVDARRDGGARVGWGEDPTVGVGETSTSYWRVPAQEGLYLFSDLALPAGGEADGGSASVGLYGALAVEPAGSTWTDPVSGALLSGTPGDPRSTYAAVRQQSGELYVDADIHPPNGPSFRESVQIAQDEIGGIGMGFNYGVEALHDREVNRCPDCVGEETWLSSWPYGDPALVKLASGPGPWLPEGGAGAARQEREDCGLPVSCYTSNVTHAYTGDPTKLRFGLAGVKETHVFHLHAHQWLADPRSDARTGDVAGERPESATIDSQSFGPGEAYTADLLGGAGSVNGTFGDSIFHCHLYPHFAEGFWALLRVHDVLLDGATRTPDGVGVRPLVPLPDRAALPAPTAENPGYPGMVPGTYGWRAPQPPGSVTEGGADGTPERPAPRLVAGAPIDPAKTALEQAVSRRANGGAPAERGAPYADPCPDGARVVEYDVTVLQRDLVYNSAGDHDPQGRLMVLTDQVADVLAGRRKPEPLFLRVNAGDCIDVSLTMMVPSWTGGDAFTELAQTNMAGAHIHLVKFDVTASDGGSNGWNYQQAAFSADQAELVRRQAAGDVTCRPSADFYGGESTGCRLEDPDPATWSPPADSAGMWGQTIHERWYADYELRTVFTHDHHFPAIVQQHGHFGALVVEPPGADVRDRSGRWLQPVDDPAHGPVCGDRCRGGAVGASVDVVGAGSADDFREHALAVQDFVPLVKKGGDPRDPRDVVNPPPAPEHFPQHDPGTVGVNYRNEPLARRTTRSGKRVDPAHRFSSWVYGDPSTPLLEGYAKDAVRMRLVQGSQEEQHVFSVHGLRWREEPDDPGSPLVASQTIGISEAFTAEMPGLDCAGTDVPCRGDYLYGGSSIDDLWNGMWGILRVHGRQTAGLLPLPDNRPAAANGTTAPVPASRQAPPLAKRTGTACPKGAPVRSYAVTAIARDLVYDRWGDHDPEGLMYVLDEDRADVEAGRKAAEPLVLRANAGDCVRVRLTNALPASYAQLRNGVDGDPGMPLEPRTGTPMGTRVSLHPQLVRADVRLSDGAAVGFNADSTAGIGQTASYEWYADTELGPVNLLDHGDVRGHRQHGLAGALVVEPAGATYHDPMTGRQVRSGTTVDVRVPGQEDFREQVLVHADGLDLRQPDGSQVPDRVDVEVGADGVADGGERDSGDVQAGSDEDAGEKGVNYRSEPLHRRLGAAAGEEADATSREWAQVFSSAELGDPLTPVVRGHAGDAVRVRVLGGNRPRQTGFTLEGATWWKEPFDAETELVGVVGGVATGRTVDAHVRLTTPGDRLWRSPGTYGAAAGVWGLSRTYPRPVDAADRVPAPLAAPDSPYAAGASSPLQVLERTSLSVTAYDDADGDDVRDPGEGPLAGARVRLLTTAGSPLLTATTGADGTAALSPRRGAYDVEVTAPDGATASTAAPRTRVDLRADAAVVDLALGLADRGGARAVVFADRDGDGVRDADEPGAPGWEVTGTSGTARVSATTGADGTAALPGLPTAGTSVVVAPRAGWRTTTPQPAPLASGTALIGVARTPGLLVRPVEDLDGDGAEGPGDVVASGVLVEAVTPGGLPVRARADDGGAVVDLGATAPAGSTVRALSPGSGLARPCAGAVVTTADGAAVPLACADGEVVLPAGAVEVALVGASGEGVLSARLVDDLDRDGAADAGEPPLVGWDVDVLAEDGAAVAVATSDETGVASTALPPGRYRAVPRLPQVDGATAWVRTGADPAAELVAVRAGEETPATRGATEPATVAVSAFSDLDGDGVRDVGDDPLADRTATLLDGSGVVLATGVTDAGGRAVFPARAGASYRVRVAVPTGWAATAPRSGGTVLTTAPVTAPADGRAVVVEVGQRALADRTPPPPPTATPGSPDAVTPFAVATDVVLAGETGAVLRYTLDGSAPSATRGMVATGPVRVGRDRLLRAVAVDAAGNASVDLAARYDLPWTGAVVPATTAAWSATTAAGVRGGVAETAAPGGGVLSAASAPVARRATVDVTATTRLPAPAAAPASVDVTLVARSSARSTRLLVRWYDVRAAAWKTVRTTTAGPDWGTTTVELPVPARAVAADGTVRVRLVADAGTPFDLAVDHLAVTAQATR
ncbi:SdrD B-like domain-containing protein [Pseudokineococcus sp. 5B2Z-1]|uniref:SdrD B-like domain-containing protein n=1 Tax=Pseudokineococcus sp. 5B2Z-1 TaxID=3132744 RepID=UPI0030ACCEF4